MVILFQNSFVRRCACVVATSVLLLACPAARADLLSVVELPKVPDQTPVDLGTLAESEVSDCLITIVNAQAQNSLSVSGYKCAEQGDVWMVTSDKAPSAPLASIKFDKNRLLFQWGPDASRVFSGGLRNCLISVQCDKTVHTIALRKPVQAPGKLIDLNRESDNYTIEIDDVPDPEKLILEVAGLSGSEQPVTCLPENRRGTGKQPVMVVLKPVDTSTLSIQFKVMLNKLGPTLTMETRPQAVAGQNNQGRPFTIKSVNTALIQSKNLLTNMKSRLAKDEQLYTQLEAKLASLNTSTNRNVKQQAAHTATIGKLQSQLNSDKQKIDQLRMQMPMLQSQLDTLPVMARMANDLDGHATIEFRVLYQIDKRFVVLFATANAPTDEPPAQMY